MTLRAIGVDNREASRRRLEKAIRGEEDQCHDITPSEEAGQNGNSSQKRTINTKSNAGLPATIGRGGKTKNK